MRIRRSMPTALGLVAGIALGGAVADASWPAGSVRTIPGGTCAFGLRLDSLPISCPFISDSDTYGALSNTYIYADYHVASSNGGWTTVEPCRQSYTGSAAVCGSGSSPVSGNGPHDIGLSGFSSLSGNTIDDYYYTVITTTESIDVVYGIGYVGP